MVRQRSVVQQWVSGLTYMQQTVVLSAIRGPDGVAKGHPCKKLVMWYRRCVVMSAFDGKQLKNPWQSGGGSFTGPVLFGMGNGQDYYEASLIQLLSVVTDDFLKSRDDLPFHYFTHMMHAAQILGYKHPDEFVRAYWNHVYLRMVHSMHLWPESEEHMDTRLGDTEEGWRAREDAAGSCST